jgi:uncharacterized protein YpmB
MKNFNKKAILFIATFLFLNISFSVAQYWTQDSIVTYGSNPNTAYPLLKLDGQALSTADQVAAYVGNECRAFQTPFIYGTDSYVTMEIAGVGNETVTFWMYQASSGTLIASQTAFQTGTPGTISGIPLGSLVIEFFTPSPDPLSAIIAGTDISCFGGATGSIDLSVSGGVTPYTFIWSNGAVSEDISGLTSGTYLVTVTDDVSTTAIESITISQPASALSVSGIVSDASTQGGSDGSIDLSVTGGTAPYTYLQKLISRY